MMRLWLPSEVETSSAFCHPAIAGPAYKLKELFSSSLSFSGMPSQADMNAGDPVPLPLRMGNEQSSMGVASEALAAGELHCHPAQLIR